VIKTANPHSPLGDLRRIKKRLKMDINDTCGVCEKKVKRDFFCCELCGLLTCKKCYVNDYGDVTCSICIQENKLDDLWKLYLKKMKKITK